MPFPRVSYWAAVTPSDSTALPPGVGLFVTGTGTVVFEGNGGAEVTVEVPDNFYLWADVRKVKAATDATGIFQLR